MIFLTESDLKFVKDTAKDYGVDLNDDWVAHVAFEMRDHSNDPVKQAEYLNEWMKQVQHA